MEMGVCHRRLVQHAIDFQSVKNVQAVKLVVDMPILNDCYRIEEYVDVELNSGDAVSWCLEITVAEQYILVEADVRRISTEGQDILKEICRSRFSTADQFLMQIRGITDLLCTFNPL